MSPDDDDPRPWAEEESLPASLHEALDARGRERMPPELRNALEARLGPLLGGGGGGSPPPGSPAAPWGWVAAAAVLVALGGAWLWRGEPAPSRVVAVASPPRDVAVEPARADPGSDVAVPPPSRERAEPSSIEPEPRPHRAERAHAVRPASEPSVEDEIALVDRAQRAVSRAPARALSLLVQHERRFPEGALAEEREVLAIEALLRLGRDAEARARGARFLARSPTSALSERVRQLVGARGAAP